MFSSLPKDTMIYTIYGARYFETTRMMEHALAGMHNDPKNIIFQLKTVLSVKKYDLDIFREIITNFQKRGVTIYLCEATPLVKTKLENAGLLNEVGNRYFDSMDDVLKNLPQIPNRIKNRTLKRLILTVFPLKLARKVIQHCK